MIKNVNDGSSDKPKLRKLLNLGTLAALPEWSTAPKAKGLELYQAIREAGYEGVQGGNIDLCHETNLTCSGSFRLNEANEADQIVAQKKEQGYDCLTCHVAWGMEDDSKIDDLINAIIIASENNNIPLYIETHRATITQDTYRTVQMVRRNPNIRFNGDFSHWYTGQEMPYGNMTDKLNFLNPVFDRVRFFHGRIGNSSHMQIKFNNQDDFVQDFKEMWTRSMHGFLKSAQPGDVLPFAPELLANNYARKFPNANGEMCEESDRWQQALLMTQIAQSCFEEAVQRHQNESTKSL